MTLFNLGTTDDDGNGTPLVRAGELLEALLGGVISRTDDVGAATAARGNAYIVPASATGAWSGQDDDIAIYDGSAWQFYTPAEGTETYVQDDNEKIRFDGSSWVVVTTEVQVSSRSNDSLGRARFSPIAESDWTAQDAATPTTNAFDGDYAHWLIEHTGDQDQSWVHTSIDGSADFDVVFAVSAYVTSDNSAGVGFFVADGNNVVAVLGPNYNNEYIEQHWTKPGTFGSNVTTTSVTPRTNSYLNGTSDVFYYRITLVGTTVTFYVSPNGIDWHELHSASDTDNSMTEIDQVGVFVDSNAVSAGVKTSLRLLGYDSNGPQAQLRAGGGGLPVAFKGFRAERDTSDQSLSSASFTDIVFNNEIFDTESGYDDTTGIFTVPASLDGKYMVFSAGVRTDSSARAGIYIEKDGTIIAENTVYDFQGVNVTSGPVLVSEGETYFVSVYPLSSENAVATPETFFGGFVIESSEDAFDYVLETGTSRTLTGADFKGNRTIKMENASAITLTLNTGIVANGPLTIIQGGAGTITMAGTATINAKGSATGSNGQYSAFTLIPTETADEYDMIGDIA